MSQESGNHFLFASSHPNDSEQPKRHLNKPSWVCFGFFNTLIAFKERDTFKIMYKSESGISNICRPNKLSFVHKVGCRKSEKPCQIKGLKAMIGYLNSVLRFSKVIDFINYINFIKNNQLFCITYTD